MRLKGTMCKRVFWLQDEVTLIVSHPRRRQRYKVDHLLKLKPLHEIGSTDGWLVCQ